MSETAKPKRGCLGRVFVFLRTAAIIALIFLTGVAVGVGMERGRSSTSPAPVAMSLATATGTSSPTPGIPTATGTPSSTPTITNTPLPTNTPTITPTPTHTPSPTATTSPGEALRAAVAVALGDSNRDLDRVVSVETEPGSITIRWTINDNFSEQWLKDGVRRDVVDMLQAVHESGLQFDNINLVGTFSMRDRLGNVTEEEVVDLLFKGEIVKQINWSDNLFVTATLPDNIYDLADYNYVNPQFR